WESARAETEASLREMRIAHEERQTLAEQALADEREAFERWCDEQRTGIAAEAAEAARRLDGERAEWSARRDEEAEQLARETTALAEARTEFEAEQQSRRE